MPATRPSYATYVQLDAGDGHTVYTGEAIYRPMRTHPLTGTPTPTIGIPDDAMHERPDPATSYQIWLNAERIEVSAVYLERIATCWWFALAHSPRHPPTV